MSIEAEVAGLNTSVLVLSNEVRKEMVDVNQDIAAIRARITDLEIALGLPEDRDKNTGTITPPKKPDGSPDDYIKYDPATKQLCSWTGEAYKCILFEPIATPQGLDIPKIIQDITTSINQTLSPRADQITAQIQAQVNALVADLIATLPNNSSVINRLDTVETGLAMAKSTLGSRIDNTVALVNSETTARTSATGALSTQLNSLVAQTTADRQAFQTFQATAAANGDSIAAATIAALQAADANQTARIVAAEKAIVDNNGASSTRLTNLESKATANSAAINSLQSTVASLNSVSADSVTQLLADVAANKTAIQNESSVRASADTALSSQLTSLVSSTNANTAAISQEASTRSSAINALSTQVTNVASQVGSYSSAIQSVQSSQSSLQSAVATSLSTLTSRVGAAETTVATSQSTLNGISGKYGISVNAAGVVTGMELLGGGSYGSQVKFQAQSFVITNSSGGNLATPFYVEGTNVYMNTAFIKQASIDTLWLAGNSVTQAQSVNSSLMQEVPSTAFNTYLQMTVSVSGTQPILVFADFTCTGVSVGSPADYSNYVDGQYWKVNPSDTDGSFRFQLSGSGGTFNSSEKFGITVQTSRGQSVSAQGLFRNVPAGTYTLSLQAKKTSGLPNFGIRSMFMTMLETKR